LPQFKFRPNTLLKIRQRERDQLRQTLAESLRMEAALGVEEWDLQESLNQSRDRTRRLVGESFDFAALAAHRRHAAQLRKQRNEIREAREEWKVEIERRTERLEQAGQKVKMLEKLKDKQYARFQEEEQRRETKRLDESARPATDGTALDALDANR
jgi:flagellar protein FliJ